MSQQVLVIDDEAVTRALLATALKRSGFDVLVAEDGAAGLDTLKQATCQLVVSDWDMPNMNGLDLCRAIRNGAAGRYVYVILLTSHNKPEHVVEGIEAGADDFVTKPFNPMEILARLRAGQRLLSLDSAEMTIFALAKLAESRDPETGAHLERVRSYCKLFAERLKAGSPYAERIDEEFVRLIFQTSPLHDIGKVGIPDCVLLKAGRLTDEEFATMKTHTLQGAATLEAAVQKYPNARFLRMAYEIALTHHEKYDGSGYPNGLRGEEIPLAGRIMAVADVYDALTTKRVYKSAFSHQIAREIIVKDSGTHFDPVVVDAFIDTERECVQIRQSYDEELSRAA